MKIEVTQEDIDKGQPQEPCHCPIALALLRQTGSEFIVDPPHIIKRENLGFLLDMPETAKDFVTKFDELRDVAPFSFDLPID